MSLPAPYSEVYLEGTGTRVEFPFGTNFKPIAANLVKCIVYLEDGNEIIPTYTVDMAVGSITISALTLPDGTILTAPPVGSTVRIYRDEPEAQNATASQLQAFTAKQLETSLDAIVAMIQEVSYTVDHKAVRLTEPQRDIILQQLLEADDDSLIYWDNDARKLVTTNYKHQDVVQCAGGLFFRLKTNTVTHNPYLQWSTDGSDWHSMDFDSIDVIATEAKQIAQDAKDIAEDAKDIAEDAKEIAEDAKEIANTFNDRLTQAEQDASDAKDIAQDASDAVSAHITDTNNPHSVTAAQVGALPNTTKYGAALSLTINSTTYVVTAQLKDQDGNNLGTAQTIDLPLESVVVSGAYDSATKEVVLTLQDGSKIRFSVADLVSGLQTEITALNMLSADLVDDTNTTHKFVTTTEKSTWNGKQDAISDLTTIRAGAAAGATAVQPGDLATVATSGSYNDLSNKPTIPTVNNPTITITQGGVTKGSFTLNQASGDTIALDAGGGDSVAIDNTTITENASNEIQAVAVIDQNTGIAKTWTGTQAEYDAIVTKDPETEYIITDDIGGSATVIAELAEAVNDKVDKGHQVVEFQEPTSANNYTWYRKYADGWVEQGGIKPANTTTVDFPVTMANAEYWYIVKGNFDNTSGSYASSHDYVTTRNTTGFVLSTGGTTACWEVKGMAA